MDMKRINAGKLRAIGYSSRERVLGVEFDNGRLIEYSGVGEETWRRLSTSASAWSYYRDNIEDAFTARHVSAKRAGVDKNPLHDLFSNS